MAFEFFTGRIQMLEYLVVNVPYTVERIADAYELKGSRCLRYFHNLQLALQCWRKAVQLRNDPSRSTPILKAIQPPAAHYNYAIEFQTMQELDNLILAGDFDALKTQSLIICERVLGSSHDEFIDQLIHSSFQYLDGLQRYQRFIDLFKYALELVSYN